MSRVRGYLPCSKRARERERETDRDRRLPAVCEARLLTIPAWAAACRYSWYPDTPGQYPESKWDWYYSDGGLYDQRHEIAVLPPSTAGPAEKPRMHSQ